MTISNGYPRLLFRDYFLDNMSGAVVENHNGGHAAAGPKCLQGPDAVEEEDEEETRRDLPAGAGIGTQVEYATNFVSFS